MGEVSCWHRFPLTTIPPMRLISSILPLLERVKDADGFMRSAVNQLAYALHAKGSGFNLWRFQLNVFRWQVTWKTLAWDHASQTIRYGTPWTNGLVQYKAAFLFCELDQCLMAGISWVPFVHQTSASGKGRWSFVKWLVYRCHLVSRLYTKDGHFDLEQLHRSPAYLKL